MSTTPERACYKRRIPGSHCTPLESGHLDALGDSKDLYTGHWFSNDMSLKVIFSSKNLCFWLSPAHKLVTVAALPQWPSLLTSSPGADDSCSLVLSRPDPGMGGLVTSPSSLGLEGKQARLPRFPSEEASRGKVEGHKAQRGPQGVLPGPGLLLGHEAVLALQGLACGLLLMPRRP